MGDDEMDEGYVLFLAEEKAESDAFMALIQEHEQSRVGHVVVDADFDYSANCTFGDDPDENAGNSRFYAKGSDAYVKGIDMATAAGYWLTYVGALPKTILRQGRDFRPLLRTLLANPPCDCNVACMQLVSDYMKGCDEFDHPYSHRIPYRYLEGAMSGFDTYELWARVQELLVKNTPHDIITAAI